MGNDEEYYRRYLAGDDSGLEELIELYNEGIILYLNTIVNNICLAEELMQETFFKIAVKKPHYSEKKHFKTWLYTIAKRCAIDYLRKQSKRKNVSIDEAFSISDETDIEKSHIKDEQKIELHSALKKLNHDYYQVLYLMYFEDFSIDEISVIMKKSKKQTYDLLYRAKKELKAELERTGFDYEEF